MMKDNKEEFDLLSSSHSSSSTSSFSCEIGDPSSSFSTISPCSVVDDDDQWLRFVDAGEIDKDGMHWKEVEQRFDQIATCIAYESIPMIDASHFGYCIGLQQSAQFAGELLQALKGRKNHNTKLTKRELYGYCNRLANPSYDSSMQIFFDMCDKDMDGRITKEDFKQMIMLSVTTNKMGMTQEEAEHFALDHARS